MFPTHVRKGVAVLADVLRGLWPPLLLLLLWRWGRGWEWAHD